MIRTNLKNFYDRKKKEKEKKRKLFTIPKKEGHVTIKIQISSLNYISK